MASTPSSVNSSIDSMKFAEGATAGAKNVNFLSQLEHMMSSVKKEAAALENMKLKLKDAEELKRKLDEANGKVTAAEAENQQLKRALKESDDQNNEIRNDMQRLNDIYYAERGKLTEAQQAISRVEQELSGVKLEKDFFAKEAAKVPDLKSAVKTARAQIAAIKKSADDESHSWRRLTRSRASTCLTSRSFCRRRRTRCAICRTRRWSRRPSWWRRKRPRRSSTIGTS
jgi:chromosome segregation ATPase